MERLHPRIILAEDDDEMRKLLAWALRADGYEVIEVDNGVDLGVHLSLGDGTGKSSEFDLVISDVRMPGLSGLQVLMGLRRLDRTLPCILFTAFGDQELHAEASRQGAAALLDKPFEIDELRTLVKVVLRGRPRA
jgi:DNA-binding response OmpR family regulator